MKQVLCSSLVLILLVFWSGCSNDFKTYALYEMPSEPIETRWISFENPSGQKGQAAITNKGAKGHAFDAIELHQTCVLADINGSGTIQRIAGTGLDYIGAAWGVSKFVNRYTGCPSVEPPYYGFYRYHIQDAVYFHKYCRVTIQQIGGGAKNKVIKMIANGTTLIPISIDAGGGRNFHRLLDDYAGLALDDLKIPNGYCNFCRSDDYCATLFFYLNKPTNNLHYLTR